MSIGGNTKQEKKIKLLTLKSRVYSIARSIFKFLGKVFAAAVILVAIGHFVPELREYMPQVYIFIEDVILGIVNWAYGLINKIIL